MKQKQYGSQAELAGALKVSGATMSRLLRRDDWPVTRIPHWASADVVKIQKWREESLREDRARLDRAGGDTAPLRREKLTQEIRKLSAQASSAELQLSKEREELVPLEEVRSLIEGRVLALRGGFMGLPYRLVLAIEGETHRGKIEVIIERELRAVYEAFLDGFKYTEDADGNAPPAWLAAPPPPKAATVPTPPAAADAKAT